MVNGVILENYINESNSKLVCSIFRNEDVISLFIKSYLTNTGFADYFQSWKKDLNQNLNIVNVSVHCLRYIDVLQAEINFLGTIKSTVADYLGNIYKWELLSYVITDEEKKAATCILDVLARGLCCFFGNVSFDLKFDYVRHPHLKVRYEVKNEKEEESGIIGTDASIGNTAEGRRVALSQLGAQT